MYVVFSNILAHRPPLPLLRPCSLLFLCLLSSSGFHVGICPLRWAVYFFCYTFLWFVYHWIHQICAAGTYQGSTGQSACIVRHTLSFPFSWCSAFRQSMYPPIFAFRCHWFLFLSYRLPTILFSMFYCVIYFLLVTSHFRCTLFHLTASFLFCCLSLSFSLCWLCAWHVWCCLVKERFEVLFLQLLYLLLLLVLLSLSFSISDKITLRSSAFLLFPCSSLRDLRRLRFFYGWFLFGISPFFLLSNSFF